MTSPAGSAPGAPPSVPRLHVIVDVRPGDDGVARAAALVDEVVAAGAPLVQLRVKGVDDATRLAVTVPLVQRARRGGALVVVNDRADVCVAAEADGVHGGAGDLDPCALRAVVGAGRLVGATARDPAAARVAVGASADYLGVGPVHPTTTKAGLPDPIGLEGLAAVTAAIDRPVVAIAGITVDRVADVLAAGAHGVAVVGAIADAPAPGAEVARFLDALGAP